MNKQPNQTSFFHRFLAIDRWKALFSALNQQTRQQLRTVSTKSVTAALLVCSAPIFISVINSYAPHPFLDLPTIAFGISAILALIGRSRLKLRFFGGHNKNDLSLAFTALALGCIPAVAVVALNPSLLADRFTMLTPKPDSTPIATSQFYGIIGLISNLVLTTSWISLTEEIIFRGLLLSIIRRWYLFKTQLNRDIFAVMITSLIFGAAHYFIWGPFAALALIGLGIGFALGYIATGEKLIPVIVIHFLFDTLSLALGIILGMG